MLQNTGGWVTDEMKPFGACAVCIAADDERWARHRAALKVRYLENTTKHAIFEHGQSLWEARAFAERTLPDFLARPDHLPNPKVTGEKSYRAS